MKPRFAAFTTIALATWIALGSVSAAETGDSGTEYQVVRIDFVIDGNTRERAIRRYVDVKEGDIFASEEAMMRELDREKQDLINYRVFKDVQMTVTELAPEGDLRRFHVGYHVVDSWTILPIPYPKYDSNTGFRIGLKTYWYNTAGTMTDTYLGLNLDIRRNETTGKLETGEWTINPEWSRIKIGRLYWTVSFLQRFEEEAFNSGDILTQYDYSYYRSVLGIGSYIDFKGDWFYNFFPTFEFRYGYADNQGWGNFREDPFNFAWNHDGGWGRIDWIENFRRGQEYILFHTIKYSYNNELKQSLLVNSLEVRAAGYVPFAKILNWYGRTGAFYVWNDRRTGVGRYIRGVRDDDMSGYVGAYLNNTLGIQFWRWEGVWDAQIHPFIDVALAVPTRTSDFVPDRDIRYGAGADFVLYLDALPSLVARLTVGFDLTRYSWSDWQKYEIIITSELFY